MIANLFKRLRRPLTVKAPRARLAVEILENRVTPTTIVGLTTNNYLVSFDSASPKVIQHSVPILGLTAGQDIVSIDARPANGVLYGLSNQNLLYTLSPITGKATLVSAGPAGFALQGPISAIDFNPTVDRLRVVTMADQNFRINPINGAIVDGDGVTPGIQPDTALAFATGDPNAGRNPSIEAVAYDRNFQGATQTTLFGIDANRNVLVKIGSTDGTPISPNLGQVTTVGTLGFDVKDRIGFDIDATGAAFGVFLLSNGQTKIFTINLTTGQATNPGLIGNGKAKFDAITCMPHQEIVYGVTASNRLVSFRAADPSILISATPLRNLLPGETLAGIDFRPASGELFGLTSQNRTVNIDPATGNVVQVGVPIVTTPQFLAGAPAGFDFNPTVDRLRLVNANDDNLRFNPLTYAPVDSDSNPANGNTPDTSLAYIATDLNVGVDPNIVASAYDRNDINGATATTLFAIDSSLNTLVRQGAVDGNAADVAGGGNPNNGLLTTLGNLGVDPTDNVSFDISSNGGMAGVGSALAVMQLQGDTVSKLFSINIQNSTTNQPTGTATLIGTVAGGEILTAMAIAPTTIQFAAPVVSVSEKMMTVRIAVTRTGDATVAASVRVDTYDGNALAGIDYTAISNQTVTFGVGETFKFVTVTILNNKKKEATKSLFMTLSNVAGGTTTVLGIQGTTRVRILNDD